MARMDMAFEGASVSLGAPSPENFFELGIIYASGREVALDLISAHKWFNLAAIKGKREAAEYRQEVASEMTKAEVAEALRAAREHPLRVQATPLASEGGAAHGQCFLTGDQLR